MKGFTLLLMALWVALAAYTALVIDAYGINLFPVFFGDIAQLGWPGQFNLVFLWMLALSASWTAWRNGFSGAGLALALIAFLGGAGFLLPYLTYLSFRHAGDPRAVLLGVHNQGSVQ